MTATTAHVIVVQDSSSMWGDVMRVVGPYPTKYEASLDLGRVGEMYPHRRHIGVSEIIPGVIAPAPKPKGKVSK